MFRHVDGQPTENPAPSRMPTQTRRGRWWKWWVAGAIVSLSTAAGGQESYTGQHIISGKATTQKAAPIVLNNDHGGVQAVIQQDEMSPERVQVPMGSSTVLDLNVPISRVEVSSPEIAGLTVLSPKQLLLSGQKVGITQVILWGENGDRLVFAVEVEPNLAQIKAAIDKLIPDAKVDVRVVNNVVIVSGRVPKVDDANRIVELCKIAAPKVQNQMIVAGEQQVVLRCTVAEVSKSAIRKLAVDAWASFMDNSPTINTLDLTGIIPGQLVPKAGGGYGTGNSAFFGNTFLFGANDNGAGFAFSSQALQMEFFVRALRKNGLLRILAEPNLVALSGQKAEFLAGGQFPVPVPQGGYNSNVTIEWKDYGIKLQFVPTVIGQQMIRLSVAPEVSEIDYTNAVTLGTYVVPGVSQRRTMTTIELPSGSTIAIAGLLREQIRGAINKTPGLGSLPVLGALFRSVDYQRDLTELVILVTPELVSAMMPDQVAAVPGKEMTDVSDWRLYGLGLLEGEPVKLDSDREGALKTQGPPRFRKFTSPPDQVTIRGPWGAADASEAAQP
jgi:pilus assembly protein CpaC